MDRHPFVPTNVAATVVRQSDTEEATDADAIKSRVSNQFIGVYAFGALLMLTYPLHRPAKARCEGFERQATFQPDPAQSLPEHDLQSLTAVRRSWRRRYVGAWLAVTNDNRANIFNVHHFSRWFGFSVRPHTARKRVSGVGFTKVFVHQGVSR
jgi:hypothetical protein